MIAIPFGIVGAILGHLWMGYELSIISLMGVVALSGVVVNDSLLMVDYANRLRKAGASAHDAILSSGVRRFRPILLTTLTTFGGLAPMIFETSRQARFMIPMAISLGLRHPLRDGHHARSSCPASTGSWRTCARARCASARRWGGTPRRHPSAPARRRRRPTPETAPRSLRGPGAAVPPV